LYLESFSDREKCPKCQHIYTREEARKLDLVWIDPDREEYRKTPVCRYCGSKFWLERWGKRTTVERHIGFFKKKKVLIDVSTVDLVLEHYWGGSGYFYETMLFNRVESEIYIENLDVAERYKTQEEAEKGHEKWVIIVKKAKIKKKREEWWIYL